MKELRLNEFSQAAAIGAALGSRFQSISDQVMGFESISSKIGEERTKFALKMARETGLSVMYCMNNHLVQYQEEEQKKWIEENRKKRERSILTQLEKLGVPFSRRLLNPPCMVGRWHRREQWQ